MTKVQNIYDSLSPLTWVLKILAINCNFRDVSYSQSLYLTKTLLTMAVIGSLNIYCLYYKIVYLYDSVSTSIKFTDSVQMVYDHFQFMVDLWFIYKFGQHISLQYFKQYESIETILHTVDYTTLKRKLIKLLSFFITIWLMSSTIDFAAWYQGYGWKVPLIYSISYFYLFIKIITTLDLTSHIMHIEMQLTVMADLVQHYYSISPENLDGFIGDAICNKNWLYPKACSRVLELKSRVHPLSKEDYIEIKWLTRCYLLLTEQVEFINYMFGFRILLNCLSLLIDIIRFTNTAVRLIVGSQITTFGERYFPAVSSLMRMLTCVIVLFSLVVHCEKTYDQKDRIVRTIDHLLVNKNPNENLRATMIELRALVLARPISFNMAKFFRLDFNFLMSLASVTATYTIILLQSMN